MGGCDFQKKRFTVPLSSNTNGKKCFKDDCINEGRCDDCHLIQGKYSLYEISLDTLEKSIKIDAVSENKGKITLPTKDA